LGENSDCEATLVYALGFALAFALTGLFGQSVAGLTRLGNRAVWVDRIAGALTLIVALILIDNDGDVLMALTTWTTGPVIKSLITGGSKGV
jgi:hypothetical protein